MDHEFDFGPEPEDRIVYIRSVTSDELPEDIREQVGEAKTLYAVHNSDGERIALVRDRRMAFVLARQNDLAPVAVH